MAKYRRRPELIYEAEKRTQNWWVRLAHVSVGGWEFYTPEEFERLYEPVPEPEPIIPTCVCGGDACFECNPGNFK